ncbi:MAG TPA: FKBP-type peptidyl-prolyl cis-trans isomerase [Candidatus Binatia bacterium]|nr:FKBP-type peptidyl-prolyl cis-trans isomerase [Candidatus Binatia bacterium]
MRIVSKKNICARIAISIAAISAAGMLLLPGAYAQQSQSPAKPPKTAPTAKSTKPATPPARKTQPTPARGATRSTLTTEKQKDSYALGMNVGRDLSRQPIDIDVTPFLQGMRDALEKRKSQLTDDEIKAALAQLQSQATTKAEAENKILGEANLKQGEEFLAGNKTKPGVVALPSGLQYKVITAGTGPKPTAADTVVCDYRGTLINGKEFDSSYKRGQPASFPVGGVIKGWTEALQMMPVGSKWELFIPPDLAYGARGAGPDIGPNSTLIFEVELHSIKGKS